MGMMKGFIHDWLEQHGWELGYDYGSIPIEGYFDNR